MMNDGTTKPDTYVSISEKFMQGEISEDEFVERYNRLIEQEAENTGNRSNHMSIYNFTK